MSSVAPPLGAKFARPYVGLGRTNVDKYRKASYLPCTYPVPGRFDNQSYLPTLPLQYPCRLSMPKSQVR
eukprot:5481867-Prymnesium_polylepis.1